MLVGHQASHHDTQAHVAELLRGRGYVILPQLFDAGEIAAARELIMRYSESDTSKVTHFQGANEDKLNLQRRVWNLLDKGDIFVDMVLREPIAKIMGAFLGTEFILGSIAANRLLPGGPGQELHVDYPYWDMYKADSFPTNINPSFPLNAQATIMLDDFTVENGATAIVPGSQKLGRYPTDADRKQATPDRLIGKSGDVAIFFGLIWHAAMPNESDADRTAILIQYLPKFVKPMEDQVRGLNPDFVANATGLLKQLLGLDYPYPQILDEAAGGNAEGRVRTQ